MLMAVVIQILNFRYDKAKRRILPRIPWMLLHSLLGDNTVLNFVALVYKLLLMSS